MSPSSTSGSSVLAAEVSNNDYLMLIFSANKELFKCVHCTASEMQNNPPTHVGVLKDAANMFNTMNQEDCVRTLAKKIPVFYHFY